MDSDAGTAPVATGGPEGALDTSAATMAQPEQPKVESAQATPATQPTPPNWDDPSNPWRQKHDGLQGNFKQVKGEADQLRARVAAAEAEREQYRAMQDQAAHAAEQARIQQLLEGDPVDLQAELKQRHQADLARQEWERVTIPRVQQEAYQRVHQEYMEGLIAGLVDDEMPEAQIRTIAQQAEKDFRKFMTGVKTEIRTRTKDPEAATLREELKASREQLKAFQRAGEASPDATPGSPVSGDDNDAFIRAYSRGESNDHARAQMILRRQP